MKKKFIILSLLFMGKAFSQFSFYWDNKYGFKIPGSYSSYGFTNSYPSGTSVVIESKKWDFGNGYETGMGIRYAIKDDFGAELGMGYLLGSECSIMIPQPVAERMSIRLEC